MSSGEAVRVPGLAVSKAAAMATASMFALTYSLSAPLIALKLADRGLDESWIGLNAAMHALGVLLIAPVLPRLTVRFGIRRLVLTALVLAALVLLGFAAAPPLAAWFGLRLLLGVASEQLFVLSETWTSDLSSEHNRGQTMATYTAVMSFGLALGPLLISAVGIKGPDAFLAGLAPLLLAALLVASPRVGVPQAVAASRINMLRTNRMAPVAIAATALNAAIETAGLSFLAIYAMRLDWPEPRAANLVSVMMVGAILLQIPIGWLGDRMDRQRLVAALSLLAGLGALAWPLALHDLRLAYPRVVVWGGIFVGISTLMLAIVGSRFRGGELVGIYAAMGLTFGVGALVGPALAGVAMDAALHGLSWFVALLCFLFLAFVLTRRRDRRS